MPTPKRRLGGGILISFVVLATALVASAAGTNRDVAEVSRPAQRLQGMTDSAGQDLVSVYDIGDVDPFVVDAAQAAAKSVGASAAPGRTGSLGMTGIVRGAKTVHSPPRDWMVPVVYTALPPGAARGVWGSAVASLLSADTVVMNELTARTTSAEAGDTIRIRAADGAVEQFRIAAIAPYSTIGGADLAMNMVAAKRLGATANTRMIIWNIDSRDQLNLALSYVGLEGRSDTRIARSWDPLDPDDTISTPKVHASLGEAWYRFDDDGSISMHPEWIDKNLTDGRVLLNSNIAIYARCNVYVAPALQAALADIDAAGLSSKIDVDNANTSGGCWNPRFSRVSGQIGFLSRHAYGMALDTNTDANCQGCVPQMDCRVVRIFRAHGFAWGGNFRRPDGMHFEWVGEPRDGIEYPSKYCPNTVTSTVATLSESPPAGLGVLTAGESIDEH